MTMICKCCTHPKRLSIDRDIVAGISLTNISKKYGVSINSVYNHKQNHLSRQMTKAAEIKHLEENTDLLAMIDTILIKANNIFERNYSKGRDGLALKALSEQRSTIELLAKISYALHEAKKLEQEQKQDEDKEKKDIEFSKKLKILNLPELLMLEKLQKKLETQDKTMIIIPDTVAYEEDMDEFYMGGNDMPISNGTSDDFNTNTLKEKDKQLHRSIRRTRLPKKTIKIEPKVKASEENKKEINPLAVKSIKSKEIEFTKWKDSELNPLKRFYD